MTRIVIVVGSRHAYEATLAEERVAFDLVLAGWPLRNEPRPSSASDRRASPMVLRHGRIGSEGDAAAVVLAVLAGSSVVGFVDEPGYLVDRLLDDLRHLGSVDVLGMEKMDGIEGADRRMPEFEDLAVGRRRVEADRLTEEELAALRLLAEGLDRAGAAAALNVSTRTLDRRLASGRRKLGASTLAQAVAAITHPDRQPG